LGGGTNAKTWPLHSQKREEPRNQPEDISRPTSGGEGQRVADVERKKHLQRGGTSDKRGQEKKEGKKKGETDCEIAGSPGSVRPMRELTNVGKDKGGLRHQRVR